MTEQEQKVVEEVRNALAAINARHAELAASVWRLTTFVQKLQLRVEQLDQRTIGSMLLR